MLLIASACLVTAILVLIVWLPWNPFERDAGALELWVPADVDAVLRADAGAVQRAAGTHALWEGPAGVALRARFHLDAKLEELQTIDARLAELPLVGGALPTIAEDFLGREVLVALAGEDVLLLARTTGRAKAIDLLRRAGAARLERWGLRVEAGFYSLATGEREIVFARRRDVLVVATSRSLLARALALAADEGAPSFALAEAKRPAAPVGTRVGFWVRGSRLESWAGRPPLAASLLAPAYAATIRGEIDVGAAERVSILARAPGRVAADVDVIAATAERLAGAGRVIAAGALPVSARDAVAALFEAQPPERRRLVDDLLKEHGATAQMVVDEIASVLADGIGFVVARLPETDSLKLDEAAGDAAQPIPATLAVLRMRGGDPAPLVDALRRRAEALFGESAHLLEESGPHGERILLPDEATSFGQEWALLRPAVALLEGQVVFSTNVAYLRRALAQEPRRTGHGDAASVRVDAKELRERLRELRWEFADRRTRHDWAQERREIARAQDSSHVPPEERARREDEEVSRRIARRNSVEFPAALRAYEESLAWLEAFTRAELRAVQDGDEIRVEGTIGLRAR